MTGRRTRLEPHPKRSGDAGANSEREKGEGAVKGRAGTVSTAAVAASKRQGKAPAPESAGAGRETRSTAKRDAILAAALDEFSQSGFAATRLDDVAVRAGVAKGTIYLYFRDKESLFQELVLAMLTPLVGAIEALGAVEMPVRTLAERMAELFVREIYETRRKDVIRLMLSEGRRFPKLAEFYYREVLAPVLTAVRANLKRAVARGEAAAGLARFPQILVAPGLIAVIWSGLFDAYEPLDVRAMMQTQIELLFGDAGRGGAT